MHVRRAAVAPLGALLLIAFSGFAFIGCFSRSRPDGGKEAVQAVVDGKINAVVECNPRFGPKAFETMAKYAAGEKIEGWVKNEDKFYDPSNAAAELANAY